MAEISRTTNLDKFQQQFDRVGDKHEATIQKRNGETFVVKGRGKSKFGRMWFSCKHLISPNKAVKVQNRSVVKALKAAAEKDFGPMGPKLVARLMKKQGLKETDSLSREQLGRTMDQLKIMKFLQDNGNLVRETGKTAGMLAYKVDQYLSSTVGQNLLTEFLKKERSPEHGYFLLDYMKATEILNSNADPAVKRAAFDMIVERYFKDGADLGVNIKASKIYKARGHSKIKGPFTKDQLTAVKKDLKTAFEAVKSMVYKDNLKRLLPNPIPFLQSLDLNGLKQPMQRFTYSIAANQEISNKSMTPLSLETVEDRARADMRKNADQVVNEPKKEQVERAPKKAKKKIAKRKVAIKKGPNKAPDPHAKVKKFLNKTPGVKNHPQLKNLTSAEFKEINTLFAKKETELLAINKAKEFLANKA